MLNKNLSSIHFNIYNETSFHIKIIELQNQHWSESTSQLLLAHNSEQRKIFINEYFLLFS